MACGGRGPDAWAAGDVDEVGVDRVIRWALRHGPVPYPDAVRSPDRDAAAVALVERHRWSYDAVGRVIGRSCGRVNQIIAAGRPRQERR